MNYKVTCALILLVSCLSKDPKPVEKLPELTTEGKNTFGCLVNGEVWIPKVVCESWFVCGYKDLHVWNEKSITSLSIGDTIRNVFSFNAQKYNRKEAINESIEIFINNVTSTGIFKLFRLKEERVTLKSFYRRNEYEYIFSFDSSVVEIIKLDTMNRIISGKFEFITNDNTYKLTNGFFDVRYEKY